MTDSKNQVAVIEIIEGPPGIKGRRIDHKGIPMVIGRSPQVDLVLPDPKVSKNHAVIEKRADKYILVDLESKNGTVVNGERIFKPEGVELHHGDEIQVSEVRLRFYIFDGLGDAELQAIQTRITFNAIQKYSNSSAVLYSEISDIKTLYEKFPEADIDDVKNRFVKLFRAIAHESGPYYAVPGVDKALACFENASMAFDFAKSLRRNLDKLNLALLRDTKTTLKKVDFKIAIDAGKLSIVLGDEGRVENVSGPPIIGAQAICKLTKHSELILTQKVFEDIPGPQRMGLEGPLEHEGKTLYKFASDTTGYI